MYCLSAPNTPFIVCSMKMEMALSLFLPCSWHNVKLCQKRGLEGHWRRMGLSFLVPVFTPSCSCHMAASSMCGGHTVALVPMEFQWHQISETLFWSDSHWILQASQRSTSSFGLLHPKCFLFAWWLWKSAGCTIPEALHHAAGHNHTFYTEVWSPTMGEGRCPSSQLVSFMGTLLQPWGIL